MGTLPPSLQALAAQRRQQLAEHYAEHHAEQYSEQIALLESSDPQWRQQLDRVLSCSDFIFDVFLQRPAIVAELISSGDLQRPSSKEDFQQRLVAQLQPCDSEAEVLAAFRRYRRREMVRMVWRDFCRLADLTATTAEMSDLAEACLQAAVDYYYPIACEQWGTPVGQHSGQPQPMVILGMGKLGAMELNVSSDIDLIFAYPEAGQTEGGRRQFSNHEFFVRFGQKIIAALNNQSGEGFVFRVDMRLRPYGDSGALVLNFDALQEYYLTQGREWERYAMIKARVVVGPPAQAEEVMAILQPFTFRKYIDYSAIEALRDLKAKINLEVRRSGLQDDIKRGAGGIREVEFIAQAFQLIRGGRDVRLRDPRLRIVYRELAEQHLLPADEVEQLLAAYRFLRDCEHAIQGINDQQTQQLPSDELGRSRVASLMGFGDWESFYAQLNQHRANVRAVFDELIGEEASSRDSDGNHHTELRELWLLQSAPQALQQQLADLGLEDTAEAARQLHLLATSSAVRDLQSLARHRLDQLMPALLAACIEEGSSAALVSGLALVDSILRRSAYMALLVENPPALTRLVKLMAASPWVAEQIIRFPALLDELLDAESLTHAQGKASLADELRQQTLRLSGNDLEEQMELLRYFRRSHALRVAAAELMGELPLMKVSDHLSWLAETILQYVLECAWQQMRERHGDPVGSDGKVASFIVVGYGKLGGIELGHGSDLDLVFIHNAQSGGSSDGERSLDNGVWFTRLGQKMIHLLTAQTHSGALYEVDMRLRPSGNSGLLVSSLEAFAKYQASGAWTWEHQALVRARVVAGDADLAEQFERLRADILSQLRDGGKLKTDVLEMRAKMQKQLGTSANVDEVDLKQDAGGIVDIEFMVQYAVLALSHQHPVLTRWSDNIRILETLAEHQLWPQNCAEPLIGAYKSLRAEIHRLQLQGKKARVSSATLADQRALVSRIWRAVMLDQQP